ncbi:low-density lipoprotein receptor-related protein 8 [Eurytemora carolleeae]|uniref:low-density lipoprotein receptor-related protein 8 n=1 Tax=Eurytemora carolleeae TaxID=1294199 RepID=UPI000C778C5D|nr:low-density lipoprotein receptor-related protein 8 [Eurytemora carolleeae]|eukprot:XP_023326052.1 low-density lipoprotein receptor-related protein 8-like [Eurytemora affinis]
MGLIQNYKIVIRSKCENFNRTDCSEMIVSEDKCDNHEEILIGNITSFDVQVVPGTRYELSVSALTRSEMFGSPSPPITVDSVATQPHIPQILRIKETVQGGAMVEIAYPCPHTGFTSFKTVWTCPNCTRDEKRHLKYVKGSPLQSGKYIEVSQLRPGLEYQVQVEASVENCNPKLEQKEEEDEEADDEEANGNKEQDNNNILSSALEICRSLSGVVNFSMECQYRCNDGSCINRSTDVRCNWIPECSDGSDEWNCTCTGFSCDNGYCIKEHQRCDGRVNCNDVSDEAGCPGCRHNQFRCGSGNCIPQKKACDRKIDCLDGSDEHNCPYRKHICFPNRFKCYNGECINMEKRCNGVPDCQEGEDEQNCEFKCHLNEFTCKDGGCIPQSSLCDGVPDCLDGSDEMKHCHCFKIQEFACRNGECVDRQKVCDGIVDCEDNSDEQNCDFSSHKHRHSLHNQELKRNTSSIESNNDRNITGLEYRLEEDGGYPDYQSIISDQTKPSSIGPAQNLLWEPSHQPENVEASEPTKNPSLTPEYRTSLKPKSKPSVSPSEPRSTKSWENIEENRKIKMDSTSHYLREVSVKVYPDTLTVREGEDVVFQCRDEGLSRAEVSWSRPGNLNLAPGSTQTRGRLEIPAVQRNQAGLYVCTAFGKNHLEGGQVFASLIVN